ncbi:MAG TPA: hypothetical protein VGD36_18465 [Xanthobacteraceae bacterium]|jgi:hypothetical protein
MRKLLTAAVLTAAFAAPAMAQEFYIVQDTATKRCQIVEQKPTTTTTTVIGNGMYKTRVEAENELKTVKVCEGGNVGTSTTTTTINR